jgi:preprotein translocase subunit SecY
VVLKYSLLDLPYQSFHPDVCVQQIEICCIDFHDTFILGSFNKTFRYIRNISKVSPFCFIFDIILLAIFPEYVKSVQVRLPIARRRRRRKRRRRKRRRRRRRYRNFGYNQIRVTET